MPSRDHSKRRQFRLAVTVSVAVVVGFAAAPRAAQNPRKTVWEGVYSEEQAVRGREAFKKSCGHCHRDDLTGGGSEVGAPPLAGPIFTVRWRDQPLADMFVAIGTTMPFNAPDTLTPQTVVDVMSYLLEMNEAPAGKTELQPDLEALRQIILTEKSKR